MITANHGSKNKPSKSIKILPQSMMVSISPQIPTMKLSSTGFKGSKVILQSSPLTTTFYNNNSYINSMTTHSSSASAPGKNPATDATTPRRLLISEKQRREASDSLSSAILIDARQKAVVPHKQMISEFNDGSTAQLPKESAEQGMPQAHFFSMKRDSLGSNRSMGYTQQSVQEEPRYLSHRVLHKPTPIYTARAPLVMAQGSILPTHQKLSSFLEQPTSSRNLATQASSKEFVVIVKDKFIDTNAQMKSMLKKHSMNGHSHRLSSESSADGMHVSHSQSQQQQLQQLNTNNSSSFSPLVGMSTPLKTELSTPLKYYQSNNNNLSHKSIMMTNLANHSSANSQQQLSPYINLTSNSSSNHGKASPSVNVVQQQHQRVNTEHSSHRLYYKPSAVAQQPRSSEFFDSAKSRKVKSSGGLDDNLNAQLANSRSSLQFFTNRGGSTAAQRKTLPTLDGSTSQAMITGGAETPSDKMKNPKQSFLERSWNQIEAFLPFSSALKQQQTQLQQQQQQQSSLIDSPISSPHRKQLQFNVPKTPRSIQNIQLDYIVGNDDKTFSKSLQQSQQNGGEVHGILKNSYSNLTAVGSGGGGGSSRRDHHNHHVVVVSSSNPKATSISNRSNSESSSGEEPEEQNSVNNSNNSGNHHHNGSRVKKTNTTADTPSNKLQKRLTMINIEHEIMSSKVQQQRNHLKDVNDLISTIQNNAMENITNNQRLSLNKTYKLEKRKSKSQAEQKALKAQQIQKNIEEIKTQNVYQKQEIEQLEAEFSSGGNFSAKNYNNLKVNRNAKRTRQQVQQIFRNTLKLIRRLEIDPREAMTTKIFSSKPFEKKNSHAFYEALKANDFESLQNFLIFDKYLVYDYDYLFMTPLHWACKRGLFKIVKLLVDHKSDVDAEDMIGRTPLSFAVENDFEDIIELLLVNKANPWNTKYVDFSKLTNNYVVMKMIDVSRRLHWAIKMATGKNKPDQWKKEISVLYHIRQQNQFQQIKQKEAKLSQLKDTLKS